MLSEDNARIHPAEGSNGSGGGEEHGGTTEGAVGATKVPADPLRASFQEAIKSLKRASRPTELLTWCRRVRPRTPEEEDKAWQLLESLKPELFWNLSLHVALHMANTVLESDPLGWVYRRMQEALAATNPPPEVVHRFVTGKESREQFVASLRQAWVSFSRKLSVREKKDQVYLFCMRALCAAAGSSRFLEAILAVLEFRQGLSDGKELRQYDAETAVAVSAVEALRSDAIARAVFTLAVGAANELENGRRELGKLKEQAAQVQETLARCIEASRSLEAERDRLEAAGEEMRVRIQKLNEELALAKARGEEADRRYELLARTSAEERKQQRRALLREIQHTVGRDIEEALAGLDSIQGDPRLNLVAINLQNARRYLQRLGADD